MQQNLNWSLIIPTFLAILQTVLYLIAAVVLLKRTKLIKSPIVGIETSAAMAAGVILFGILLISCSSIESLFRSFIFQNGVQVYSFESVFSRFGQFFFVTICSQLVFLFITWYISNMFIEGGSILEETRTGNISMSVLFGSIAVGISICCFMISKNVCDLIVPTTLNFR